MLYWVGFKLPNPIEFKSNMAQVVMSENPKIIRKFLHGNGTVTEGTIDQALGSNVAGTRGNKELPRASQELSATPKKICLECSSPAVEGKDYCSFCAREMGK